MRFDKVIAKIEGANFCLSVFHIKRYANSPTETP